MFHRCVNTLADTAPIFQKMNILFLLHRKSKKEGNGLKSHASIFVISKLLIEKNRIAQYFVRFHPWLFSKGSNISRDAHVDSWANISLKIPAGWRTRLSGNHSVQNTVQIQVEQKDIATNETHGQLIGIGGMYCLIKPQLSGGKTPVLLKAISISTYSSSGLLLVGAWPFLV